MTKVCVEKTVDIHCVDVDVDIELGDVIEFIECADDEELVKIQKAVNKELFELLNERNGANTMFETQIYQDLIEAVNQCVLHHVDIKSMIDAINKLK